MADPTGDAAAVRVLVLVDDPALSAILCDELRARRHVAVAVGTVAEALEAVGQHEFDVALLDLTLPDGSGIDVLGRFAYQGLPTQALVLTAVATVDTAIEAMRLGAYGYVSKPPRMDELELLVQKAAHLAQLRRENLALRTRLERPDDAKGLVADDPAMRAVLAAVERAAASDVPILVRGEKGTGHELVARAVHARSPRAAQPFVAVDCGAIPGPLLEAELFGQERGAVAGALARTPGLFELADRGVLFLDDVGRVPPSLQAKLVRAVETRELVRVGGTRRVRADVRIMAASPDDLKAEAQAGRFRADLYARLDGVAVSLPPLRERRADIPGLARHFLDRVAPGRTLTPRALEALRAYPWPGNVRELQMVVQRAAIVAAKDVLDAEDLPPDVRDAGGKAVVRPSLTLAQMEREYIEAVLRENQGHRGRTARALGIDPKTLYNKLGPEQPRKKPVS